MVIFYAQFNTHITEYINLNIQLDTKQSVDSMYASKPNSDLGSEAQVPKTNSNLVDQLLQLIICDDKKLFGHILHKVIFQTIRKQIQNHYISRSVKALLVKLLQYYIKSSLDKIQQRQKSSIQEQADDIQNFGWQFGKKIHTLIIQIKMNEQWVFDVLEFFHKFSKFQFSLQNQSSYMSTFNIIKSLCQNDIHAIFYFSAYLCRACEIMESKGIRPIEIQSTFRTLATKLKDYYGVQNLKKKQLEYLNRDQQQDQLNVVPSLSVDDQPLIFHLKSSNRQEELQDKIMQMVQIGKNNYNFFNDLLYIPCIQNQGYSFKSNLKLQGRQNKASLHRVKQKMLKDIIKTKLVPCSENQNLKRCKTIAQWRKKQIQYLNSITSQICQGIDKIQFQVTDILRGKCMFNKVKYINKAAKVVINKIKVQQKKGKRVKLVQIDNRLQKITKDLVFKIKIEELVCQFQFVLSFHKISNQIHHKMYQLVRSKTLSALTLLYNWNDVTFNNYLFKLQSQLKTLKNNLNLNQYQDLYGKLKQFFKITPLFHFQKQNAQQVDKEIIQKINYLKVDADKVKQLQQNKKIRSLSCLKQLKKYKQALNLIQSPEFPVTKGLQNIFQINLIGQVHIKLNNLDQALKILQNCLELTNKSYAQQTNFVRIKILKNIGYIYLKRDNFSQAMDYFNKCTQYFSKNPNKDPYYNQIHSKVLRSIGVILYKKGKYQQSLNYQNKSLQIVERIYGIDDIRCSSSLLNIGVALQALKKFPQALDYYEKCLAMQQKVSSSSDNYASILNNMSLVYLQMGKYQNSLNFLQRSIKIKEKVYGKDSIYVTANLHNIAIIYRMTGKYQQALTQLDKANKIRQDAYQKNTVFYAQGLRQKGLTYLFMNNLELALQYLMESFCIIKQICGQKSKECIDIYNQIANVYYREAKYAESLSYYEKALETAEINFGCNSVEYGEAANNIAPLYQTLADYNKSLDYFQKSLQIFENKLGKNSNKYSIVLGNIGNIYKLIGKYEESVQILQQSLAIIDKIQGQNSLQYAIAQNQIGDTLKMLGRYSQAVDHFKTALSVFQNVQGKESYNSWTILNNIGQIFNSTGNYLQALNYFNKTLNVCKKHVNQDGLQNCWPLNSIGIYYSKTSKFQIAKQYYQKSLEIISKIQGDDSLNCAFPLNNIGVHYFNINNYSQALEFVNKSREIIQKFKGKQSSFGAFCINNVGCVLFGEGKYQEALNHFRESLQICQKLRGKDSVDSIIPIHNLSQIYNRQKNLKEFSEKLKKSVELKQKYFGFNRHKIAPFYSKICPVYMVVE